MFEVGNYVWEVSSEIDLDADNLRRPRPAFA